MKKWTYLSPLSHTDFHLVNTTRCYDTALLAHMILHYAYSRVYVKRRRNWLSVSCQMLFWYLCKGNIYSIKWLSIKISLQQITFIHNLEVQNIEQNQRNVYNKIIPKSVMSCLWVVDWILSKVSDWRDWTRMGSGCRKLGMFLVLQRFRFPYLAKQL